MTTQQEGSEILTARNLEALKQMNLMNDMMMTTFFDDVTCLQILLENILEDKQLKITKVNTQLNLSNLYGHSSRLDILAKDHLGTNYNIEIQCSAKGTSSKRARYYSSIMDVHSLHKGDSYDNLPDSYIIFIVEKDLFHHSLPIYHFERIMKGKEVFCNDGTHIIYVNAKMITAGKLGDIMHDFYCVNADDMRIPYFAQRMQFFKEEREGQIIMCDIIERLQKEAVYDGKIEIAQNMLRRAKYSYEEIVEDTGLSMDKVLELAKQQSA